MPSSNTLESLDDADLKSRLARFGINQPITKTTINVLHKKLLKLEMDFQRKQNNRSIKLGCESMTNTYTIMSSNSRNTIDEADLKSRLARFGINQPITNTTRNVLHKKLLKLEMDFEKDKNNQSIKFGCESMDTSTNDLNEYEIRDGISKHGLNQVPLTDSTRPVISNIIRKKNQNS
ncbi:unnamed protein product [Macrosiphum euphorbiae]|uniref:LEM domain-containing protein n=1 Tax=Macrosiphum euphorbiae TaxID=13131 RepID=A0AAV0W9U2_9HEMI|nr:unnamed protein product [Macrosiphum euphorbiae]